MKRDAAFWQHQAETLAEALQAAVDRSARLKANGRRIRTEEAQLLYDNAVAALAAYALALIDQ